MRWHYCPMHRDRRVEAIPLGLHPENGGQLGHLFFIFLKICKLSFLDKSPTVILDIDKEAELFDGSGEKGLLLIPEHLEIGIKDNIDFYLRKAGIIERRTIKAPPRPERGR